MSRRTPSPFWAIAVAIVKGFFRDKASVFFALIFPLMFLVLFGGIFLLFWLFISSWGQWICAFAPSFTVISNVLPFFFVMFGLFNGVVRPYATLPVFWKYWMYYVK